MCATMACTHVSGSMKKKKKKNECSFCIMINPLDIIIPMLFTPEFVSYNHVVLLGPPLPSFLA